MNIVWLILTTSSLAIMLLINPDGALSSMIQGAIKAVSLSLSLLASYSLWLGLFNLIGKLGWQDKIARLLRPVLRFLFPSSSKQTESLIAINAASNLIGLGNAATLSGINAICSMDDGSGVASDNMLMLLIISSTSLQLIPSTVITMRASHGSQSPASFLPACLVATVLSTVIGITLAKLLARRRRPRLSAKSKTAIAR